ncbi:hypothetical protein D7Z26_24915 [Cohnella endophytica]|uniref:DUF6677 domain-containing protein n=1 Tax=Cohnella endophytica TaxID=2419778 RepID=A0A494X514_9BACL|nr:DUF6677 family protein [Cohnella endophytica]RKP45797.1 hypothetical protein D7Z26_24915 [Cohnella endophytica]
MKKPEEWDAGSDYPLPPSPDGEPMNQEPWPGYGPVPGYPREGHSRIPNKKNWIAGLLAFLVPGIGHMYLGRMLKGIVLMLLVALDIVAIVYASLEKENVFAIVLLSVLLPVVYFYNLFDAIKGSGFDPNYRYAKRKKWVAGLLAFLVPGIGHMYLRLMVKGIVLMVLIALDISAIVYVSVDGNNVLSIVLLSLLLPIIYFYSLFDAIQSTDYVNDRNAFAAAHPPMAPGRGFNASSIEESLARGVPPLGIMFLSIIGVVILIMAGAKWTNWLFHSFSSMLGAIILIGAGVGLWIWETRGPQRKGN